MSTPSLIHGQAAQVLDLMNAVLSAARTFAVGAAVTDGGTTQASGASGALNFDVDVSAIDDLTVNGAPFPAGVGAAVDAVATGGDGLVWGGTSDLSVVIALVLSTGVDNDTPAYTSVQGSPARTGDQDAPSDSAVAEALGHGNFLRICDVTVNRTGDTTVTLSFDHSVRNPARGLQPLRLS